MPPKRPAPKRNASSADDTTNKRKKDDASESPAYVDRRYYPAEMSSSRCAAYTSDALKRPIEALADAQEGTESARAATKTGRAVVHWFKRDLRLGDNAALAAAAARAKADGAALIGLFVLSPQDLEAHVASAPRVDFDLRSLAVVRADLARIDIPLWCETVPERADVPDTVLRLCESWGASHLYAAAEYEVDELRREAKLVAAGADRGIAVEVLHDACVVAPGSLHSGSGNQYSVYSPWFRAWVAHVHSHPKLLKTFDAPGKNPASARKDFKDLFGSEVPDAPKAFALSADERKRFAKLWPAGEHEAKQRLDRFLKEKGGDYKDQRNFPVANATGMVSVHLAAGTLAARTAVAAARDANSSDKLDKGSTGLTCWISEVAWRDFYKHVLAHWPYVCMNKPFKPEYANIEWEYDDENLEAWKTGKTGYPIVDAAMRQLNHTGYMHNRCRMIAASFLAKHLMLDWRLGERYFMTQLIDGDFASNNGGWGFSSSTGVDPQPYFRIFNPLLQSEKFDADGDYIRKWVPELSELDNRKIHDPWGRGAEAVAKKKGYPKPIVEHKFARERALARYKEGLGRGTA